MITGVATINVCAPIDSIEFDFFVLVSLHQNQQSIYIQMYVCMHVTD